MELEYAEHKLRDSPCLWGKISLKKIVESFSAGINEEQAWACLYQSLLFCKKSIIALSTSGSIVLNESLICPDIDNLYLDKDGFVAVVKSGSEVEELVGEEQFLRNLAFAIFAACQYNTTEDQEVILSDDFVAFLEQMGKADQFLRGDNLERAAGDPVDWIEPGTSDEDDLTVSTLLSRFSPIDHFLKMAQEHNKSESDASTHYQAVCRALFVESLDFREFLHRVQFDKFQESVVNTELDSNDREEPSRNWARAWMQVIRDLRAGVRLRKVSADDGSNSRIPGVYEMTPYEMLMEDIRLRRFSLKASNLKDEDRSLRGKMTPHDRILDYIRSRPPLSPVQNRKLRPKRNQQTPAELLMDSIRHFTGQKLRKTPMPQPKDHFENYCTRLRFSPERSPSPSRGETMETFSSSCNGTIMPKRKLIIPDEETTHIDFLLENHDTSGDIEEENELDLREFSNMTGALNFELLTVPKKTPCAEVVSLTLDEIALIRGALAKAELENLEEQDVRLFDDIRRSKVCFSCRRVKFSHFSWMFGEVGVKCHLCQNTICVSCSRQMVLPCDRLDRIPVHTLSPALEDETPLSLTEPLHPALSQKRPKSSASSTMPRQRLQRSHTQDFTSSTLPKPQSRNRPALQRGMTVTSLSPHHSQSINRRKISLPSEEPAFIIQVCVECHSVLYHAIVESQTQLTSVCSTRPVSQMTTMKTGTLGRPAPYYKSASSVVSDSQSDSLDEDFNAGDLGDFLDDVQAHQSALMKRSHCGGESVSPANSRSDSTSSEAGSFYSNHI